MSMDCRHFCLAQVDACSSWGRAFYTRVNPQSLTAEGPTSVSSTLNSNSMYDLASQGSSTSTCKTLCSKSRKCTRYPSTLDASVLAHVLVCAYDCSNMKKILNHIDRSSKDIKQGGYVVRMISLGDVADQFSPTAHGMKATDYDVKRNRQAVPPVERMVDKVRDQRVGHTCCVFKLFFVFILQLDFWGLSQKVRDCMASLGDEHRGTLAFLDLVATYMSVFDPWRAPSDCLNRAAYVTLVAIVRACMHTLRSCLSLRHA